MAELPRYRLAAETRLTLHPDGSSRINGEALEAAEGFLLQHLDWPFADLAAAFAARFGQQLTADGWAAALADFADQGWIVPTETGSVSPRSGDPVPISGDDDDAVSPTSAASPALLVALARASRSLFWGRHLLWGLVPLTAYGLWRHQDRFWLEVSGLDVTAILWLKAVVAVVTVNLGTQLLRAVVAIRAGVVVAPFAWRRLWGIFPRLTWPIPVNQQSRSVQRAIIAAGLRAKLWLFCLTGGVWLVGLPLGHELGHGALLVSQLALGAWLLTANPLWPGDGARYLGLLVNQPRWQHRAAFAWGALNRGQRPVGITADGLLYGAASGVFLVALVVLLASRVFLELRDLGRGAGVVVFLVGLLLVGDFLRRRFRRSAAAPSRGRRVDRATPPAGRWLLWAGLLLVVGQLPYPAQVTGAITLEPQLLTVVRAPMAGRVATVAVTDGAWVAAGAPLLALDEAEWRHQEALVAAEMRRLTAELALLDAGAAPTQRAVAAAQVAAAASRAGHSAARRELLRDGVARGSVSPLEWARVQADADADAQALAVAQAQQAQVNALPRPTDREPLLAALAKQQVLQSWLRQQRQAAVLTAPHGGQVLTLAPEQRVGTAVAEGEALITLGDTRQLLAHLQVMETDVAQVRVGQAAQVGLWASPTTRAIGRVIAVGAAVARDSRGRGWQRVTVALANDGAALRPGWQGYAKIAVDTAPVWRVFGRAIGRFVTVEMWAWLP